jgi:hypothetical protein
MSTLSSSLTAEDSGSEVEQSAGDAAKAIGMSFLQEWRDSSTAAVWRW